MKRVICLVVASLLLATVGCKDENYPTITRINVSENCGVVPMNLEVYGAASGGNESGGATGGVNNLEYVWDFGDGTGSTSISYHTYNTPSDSFYTVTLTVTDPDGKSDTSFAQVTVFSDSLSVAAETVPATGITANMPVMLDYLAESCAVDPLNDDDYVKLNQTWTVTDAAAPGGEAVYYGRNPTHTFSAAGTYDVNLHVYYAAWEVHRHVDLQVVVGP